MLDSLQNILAITALGSISRLVYSFLLQDATRGSCGSRLVRSSVVGMASHPCPAMIRHDLKNKETDGIQVRRKDGEK